MTNTAPAKPKASDYKSDTAPVWGPGCGDYTVLVTEAGSDSTVAYNLALQCLFGGCTSQLPFSDDFESGDTTAWSKSVPAR